MDARDAGEVFGRFLILALIVGLVVWFVVRLLRRPKGSAQGQGDAQSRWTHAVQVCSADPRYRLGQIISTQVYAQRGSAGWVTWYGSGRQQNVWFEQAYPTVGAWVVVTGSERPGTPGTDPNTFFVERIHDVIA